MSVILKRRNGFARVRVARPARPSRKQEVMTAEILKNMPEHGLARGDLREVLGETREDGKRLKLWVVLERELIGKRSVVKRIAGLFEGEYMTVEKV